MKVMTVLGTRPEIIRLSRIIEKLDVNCDQILVHTGQNYDVNLKDIFFEQLRVRQPDVYMEAVGSLSNQVGVILSQTEKLIKEHKPDRFLILGDTNSALSAFIAKRMGIPIYHMEAGNRCFDDRVPEEVNRRVIDHSSDILMPYTERSRQNLLREGINSAKIFVTGNPIKEVILSCQDGIEKSNAIQKLGLKEKEYFLVTMHRAENVDNETRIRSLVSALEKIHQTYKMPVIISTHPHTRARMNALGIHEDSKDIRFMEPFGFFDFIRLEKNAACLLSDSGTVQEEACLFKVPNVTMRDVTERPETVECGSNILSGVEVDTILRAVNLVINKPANWSIPIEYQAESVSDT
ncbi:MAG: UDP-N-acetylglucosamine 2-epimerase (non-hydrolyzing), partial [Nitrospirota bacterium]|nr:UDP-N-acetylglucosamine 2-epimerase (non-hydrolyzing) [Nitrospirota bacterium]